MPEQRPTPFSPPSFAVFLAGAHMSAHDLMKGVALVLSRPLTWLVQG